MNKWNKANKTILFGVLMPPAIFFTYKGTYACFKPPSLNTSLNIEGVSLIHSHFEDFEAVLPDQSPDLPEGSPYQNEIGIESSVAISGSTVIATINIGPLGPVNTSPFSPINIDPFDL